MAWDLIFIGAIVVFFWLCSLATRCCLCYVRELCFEINFDNNFEFRVMKDRAFSAQGQIIRVTFSTVRSLLATRA